MFPVLSEIASLLLSDYINTLAYGASVKTSLLELAAPLLSRLFSYCFIVAYPDLKLFDAYEFTRL